MKKMTRGLFVLILLVSTTGCLDLFVLESDIEIIAKGKGVYARGFKPGKYRGSGKSTDHVVVAWIKKDKEYEMKQSGQQAMRFRLKKLKRKYYLLQSREDADLSFQYFIIHVDKGRINFPDIKEESKDRVLELKEKYKLARDEDDKVTAPPGRILAFLKAVIKQKCLKPGHSIQLIK